MIEHSDVKAKVTEVHEHMLKLAQSLINQPMQFHKKENGFKFRYEAQNKDDYDK